ncbi:male accessory gland serine protease inhibitor-like [Musca autumnalis]|uniref:male accessory gland serine protease inhibitor-like n=1 Tax=Musca autumnalis TaxID=221902 RepID=UPI003CECE0EB
MKLFVVVILAIFAAISSTIGLKHDICGLKHSSNGDSVIMCAAYFPSWSYRADTNECVDFIYGGCGGNDNRFGSKDECESKCKE